MVRLKPDTTLTGHDAHRTPRSQERSDEGTEQQRYRDDEEFSPPLVAGERFLRGQTPRAHHAGLSAPVCADLSLRRAQIFLQ